MSVLRSFVVCGFIASICCYAQETRGTLLGRVIDSSNAVVPNITVRAINSETGTAAAGRSNQSGTYGIPYLLPGTYRIEAELHGFKKFVREGVQIRVADSVAVDVTMIPGEVVETIDVKETTPLLEASTASLGQVVDQKRIVDLPLGGGNSFALALLAPGTASTVNLRYKDAGRPDATSNWATDGTRSYGNEYAIGHTAGSIVNVSIKSGTNDFHGEMHEFLRNRVLDSKDFFQNSSGQALPVYQYNRFGFAAGAPVISDRHRRAAQAVAVSSESALLSRSRRGLIWLI